MPPCLVSYVSSSDPLDLLCAGDNMLSEACISTKLHLDISYRLDLQAG